MAVYKRSYRGYTGALTPRWSRFLILSRYAARGVFKSRIFTGLFVLSFFCPLVMIAGLYLNHNARVLTALKIDRGELWQINGQFFMVLMGIQSSFAFLMTAFVGPNMIAPDLANNALPLYFCRPLSRTEYVVGRASVIFYLLSWITWVPGMVVFIIEASLSGGSWAWDNKNLAAGVMVGSVLWIIVLALLALALSAWVRWKLIAGALLLGVMFFTSGFAAALNGIARTTAGFYLDPAILVGAVYANFFGVDMKPEMSTAGCVMALVGICAFCVYLLSRKVRAFEVVR